MREYETPGDGSDAAADATDGADHNRIVVAVVRTGGIAGLRRRWRVEPEPEQAPQWVALVERCPWDEQTDAGARPDASADRYVWSIHAVLREEQRERVVPDTQLHGAWRELVDAVRDADRREH
ncbi:MAG TPA: protealysin inhibitor emfourin [Microbacterium sp.]|nr:protealysin inhibitor emfourin [Microbacterium sp.]